MGSLSSCSEHTELTGIETHVNKNVLAVRQPSLCYCLIVKLVINCSNDLFFLDLQRCANYTVQR